MKWFYKLEELSIMENSVLHMAKPNMGQVKGKNKQANTCKST